MKGTIVDRSKTDLKDVANANRCAGKMFEVDLDDVVGIGVDDNEVLFHFLTADGSIHEYDLNGVKTDFTSIVRVGRGNIDDGLIRGWHPFYAEDGSIDVALILTDTQVLFHTPDPNTPNTCLLYTSPSPRD